MTIYATQYCHPLLDLNDMACHGKLFRDHIAHPIEAPVSHTDESHTLGLHCLSSPLITPPPILILILILTLLYL